MHDDSLYSEQMISLCCLAMMQILYQLPVPALLVIMRDLIILSIHAYLSVLLIKFNPSHSLRIGACKVGYAAFTCYGCWSLGGRTHVGDVVQPALSWRRTVGEGYR